MVFEPLYHTAIVSKTCYKEWRFRKISSLFHLGSLSSQFELTWALDMGVYMRVFQNNCWVKDR